MNSTIIKAIEERRLLTFEYKGEHRMVEPHTYGCTKKGANGICAWQIKGSSGPGYRLFLEPEMESISASEDRFEGPRSDYLRGDQRFVSICAEL